MSILNDIVLERYKFLKAWGQYPDIVEITESMFSEIPSPLYGSLLFNMEVDIGKELKCKFRDTIELNKG